MRELGACIPGEYAQRVLGEQPDVVRALAEELRVLKACGSHQCAHTVARRLDGAPSRWRRAYRAHEGAQAGCSGDCRVGQAELAPSQLQRSSL